MTKTSLSRRNFLAASVVAAASSTIVQPQSVVGAEANSVLEVALIGCGGRGDWITEVFAQNKNYRLVAVSDYFQDKADAVGTKREIPADRRYSTLSGYKRLLDSKLDVAVIETPPSFHPEQAAAAVDAGKHVILAKPIAIDVPGCVSVADSGKKATQKKLAFLVDFQSRAHQYYREALKRVHAGDIGQLISLYAYYPQAGRIHDEPLTDRDSYLRLWYQSLELSGCCIVEQDIHVLDVATWIVGKNPLWAAGTGGRTRQYGNINDHYNVTYGFDGNVTLQFASVKGVPEVKNELMARAWGTGGILDTCYGGDVNIRGKKPYEGGNCANIYWEGTETNVREFYEAIVKGDFSNPTVEPSVRSNLTCVLGRDAVMKKKLLTWDEMMRSNESIKMKLDGLKS